uniref:Uncharacterized protein n=1 Tax=Panagrolaimus sp. PS1159 TaxID=55785 RepID=A0AC35F8L0_9BILA
MENEDKSKTWNNFSKIFSTLNENESKKCWKKSGLTDTKNSTLSLHIKAYKNSVENTESDSINVINKGDWEKEKFGTKKKLEKAKQVFATSTFVIQNSFEFQRQQNYDVTEPELSQFKASQQLLDHNETLNNDQQKGNNEFVVVVEKKVVIHRLGEI